MTTLGQTARHQTDGDRGSIGRRWGGLVAAAVVGVVGTVVAVSAWGADAAPGDNDSTYVAWPGCRLTDTRPPTQIGPRGIPLGAGDVMTVTVHGNNGDCTGPLAIPDDAVALATNVTAVGATTNSNIRVYRGDLTTPPLLSNLNVFAGAPPTPNKVDVQLAPNGTLKVFNANGQVDIIIDVVGYYTPTSLTQLAQQTGPQGPQGPAGPQGEPGEDATSPARVFWVADDGTGDFTSVADALSEASAATEISPILVRIAPGQYTEASTVDVPAHVEVVGSGVGITSITCACGGSGPVETSATVTMSSASALRDVTVNNTGGSSQSIGIYTSGTDPKTISNVAATATGASDNLAVYNDGSSSLRISNVAADAVGGAQSIGIRNKSASGTITNVTISATGGADSFGIINTNSSSPAITNSTVTVAGGGSGVGIQNSSSSPTITDTTVTVTGGSNANYGLFNFQSSPILKGATVSASGSAGDNYGIFHLVATATDVLEVKESAIAGDTAAIDGQALVASSMLDGGVSGGTYVCVGAYDEDYAPLDADCQPVP